MKSNPCQTQKSVLENKSGFKRSLWWKVYFFFITTLTAFGMASLLTDPEAGIAEYIYLLLWVIGTVGFFGFVFLKQIYKPGFWLKLVIAYVAYNIIYFFVTRIDQRMGMDDTEFYSVTAIGLLITLPAYYAIYAYSNPNNPVWKNA